MEEEELEEGDEVPLVLVPEELMHYCSLLSNIFLFESFYIVYCGICLFAVFKHLFSKEVAIANCKWIVTRRREYY